jgi:hypothetical protein
MENKEKKLSAPPATDKTPPSSPDDLLRQTIVELAQQAKELAVWKKRVYVGSKIDSPSPLPLESKDTAQIVNALNNLSLGSNPAKVTEQEFQASLKEFLSQLKRFATL